MRKFNVIVVDSEVNANNKLLEQLKLNQHLNILSAHEKLNYAFDHIFEKRPEIIFFEISEEPGMAFFEFLNKVLEYIPDINWVFMSKTKEFAYDVFDYLPFSFLLKPYQDNEIEKLENKIKSLLNPYSKNKFIVKTKKSDLVIDLNKLMMCSREDNFTKLYYSNRVELLKKPMFKIEKFLRKNNFFKAHRSNIINLNFVKEIDRENWTVVLSRNSSEIIAKLSPQRYNDLLKVF